jgi:hypothetical protein
VARFNIANGSNPNFPLTVVCDTQGKTKTVTLQNVSSVDCYVSDDANQLQNTSPSNLPQVGWHFAPDTAGITPFILVLYNVNVKLYARTNGAAGQMECILLNNCSDAQTQAGGGR